MNYIPTYTKQGMALMARLLAEGNAAGPPFVRVDVGGEPFGEDEPLSTLTEIRDVRQRMPISSVSLVNEQTALIRFVVTNLPNVHLPEETNSISLPYDIESIGVIARDPEVGDILYAVFIPEADSRRDQITPYIEGPGDVINFNLQISIQDAETVYLVAGTGAFAMADELVAHVTDKNNPHDVTIDQLDYEGRPLRTFLKSLEDVSNAEKAISTTPTQRTVPVYDGEEKSLTDSLNAFDPAVMILGGTLTASDAGTYTATVTPKTGFYWADNGTNETRDIPWRIAGIPVTAPAQVGELTFTGAPQQANLGEIPEGVTMSGEMEATDAGTRQAIATLDPNYEWDDGTTAPKPIPWAIGKAAGSLSVNKKSVDLTIASMTQYVQVSRAGDGAISVVSSDPDVVAATIAGEQITLTGKRAGSAKITVSVRDSKNYLSPASETISVTCTVPTSNPDEATAADIKGLVAAGLIDNYFDEGDNFPITLVPQTIRGQAISGNYAIRYLETGHNAAREGANRSHFMFPVSSTDAKKNLAFCHTATLHNYVQMGQQGFYMNPATSTSSSSSDYYGTTEGGWRDSDMRTSLLPALLKCLPKDWQDIISLTTKYTSNGKRAANNTQAEVTATQDKLWLFSEFEVFGARTYANEYEKNFQTQYNHWKNGNDKRFYNHTNPASSVRTWLRSPGAGGTNYFCVVYTGGSASSDYASYSCGVCAGFTVAA